MGELDGDFSRQLALSDFLEHAQVVIAHRGGLVAARDLLAELGQHATHALPGEVGGCGECRVEVLPGHEPPHGAAEERPLGQLPREPWAAGCAEQQAAEEGHGREKRQRDHGRGKGCTTHASSAAVPRSTSYTKPLGDSGLGL